MLYYLKMLAIIEFDRFKLCVQQNIGSKQSAIAWIDWINNLGKLTILTPKVYQ